MNKAFDVQKLKKEAQIKNIIRYIIIYLFLVICAFIVIFPFYYMIITSFKSFKEFTNEGAPTLFPKAFTLESYITAFKSVSLIRYMGNTLLYSVITTLIMLVVVITAAFAFARLKFKGKNLVFSIYLATMMIPMELFTITNYATVVNLNMKNSFTALILPTVLSVFYIYLLRQNFMQVPDEMYYAAKVDGTSDFNYMMKVLVPLSKPTLIFITVLKFIECWNSYVWPRLVIDESSEYNLVSTAIEIIRTSGFGKDNIPAMMASVVIISLPLLIIFIVFRRQIMQGVSRNGLKG